MAPWETPTPLGIDCNYRKYVTLPSIVDRKAGQHLCSLSTCDAFLFLKFAYRISAGSSEVSPVIYTWLAWHDLQGNGTVHMNPKLTIMYVKTQYAMWSQGMWCASRTPVRSAYFRRAAICTVLMCEKLEPYCKRGWLLARVKQWKSASR